VLLRQNKRGIIVVHDTKVYKKIIRDKTHNQKNDMFKDTTEGTEEETNEETNEDTNETETQETEQGEDNGADSDRTYTKAELDQQLKDRDKRWKDRLKSSKEGSKETKEVGSDDRVNRIELKAEGIKDKKAQDVVLEYIAEKKVLGKEVDIETALKSVAVKEALQEIKAKNVPPPSTRTAGGASDSIAYWIQETKKGNFPTDPAIRKQLRGMKIF